MVRALGTIMQLHVYISSWQVYTGGINEKTCLGQEIFMWLQEIFMSLCGCCAPCMWMPELTSLRAHHAQGRGCWVFVAAESICVTRPRDGST
jgi:hypothetical protein